MIEIVTNVALFQSLCFSGAGSMLGGVTRLTLAVTVIVIEMNHDIDLTIPVLIAVFVAKVISSSF